MSIKKEHLVVSFGVLTLLIFATKPYIIEFLYPSKSIGQLIGENAKDIIDGWSGKKQIPTNSDKDIFQIILNITGFIFFAITVMLSATLLKIKSKKKFGVIGLSFAILGLGIQLYYFTLGFILLIALGVLAIAFLYFIEGM